MGDLVLKGATSGQITITPTGVAGTNTLTLPAKTGNIITSADSGTVTQGMLASNVAGSGPAFSAYQNTNVSISNATFTKAQINTEEFDTNNNFDSTTNYRFTPTVAGYYQVNGEIKLSGSAAIFIVSIYKNGTEFKKGVQFGAGTSSGQAGIVAALVYLNGSSDYVELWAYQGSGGTLNIEGGAGVVAQSYFQAALVRAA